MLDIYKPTAKNTGSAISLQASDRDGHLYLNFIRQHSWDATRQKGSFRENKNKPGLSTTLKFNQIEAGAWLDAIERFVEFSAFHGTQQRSTRISFNLAEGDNPTVFVLRVSQTDGANQKASFFIPISFGEARAIKEYLIHYLHKSFKKQRATQESKQGLDTPNQQEPEPTADPTPVAEESFVEAEQQQEPQQEQQQGQDAGQDDATAW